MGGVHVRGRCAGLKLHEDWGTTPAAIDTCLAVAEEHDVQVGAEGERMGREWEEDSWAGGSKQGLWPVRAKGSHIVAQAQGHLGL